MPVVGINKDLLFKELGRSYEQDEFENLCFDFGIELDDVLSKWEEIARQQGEDAANASGADKNDIIYKIEVPANRYDLLCVEGLTRALRIFKDDEKMPEFETLPPQYTVTVKPATKQIRQYLVAAVLRNVSLTEESFQSFLDLQDKLHFNICRRRSLVAIGTHDLASIEPPFIYDARGPDEIAFQALKEDRVMTARELFTEYNSRSKKQCQVQQYLPIIENSPVYPVIYDANGVVLSLPPIINGEHSKMSAATKDIFIECTATDLTKAKIVINTLVTMIGQYCEHPFQIEQVRVAYEGTGVDYVVPDLNPVTFNTTVEYINRNLGTNLSGEDIETLLPRMQLPVQRNGDDLTIFAPPTRSDILHPIDIVEDVAIAFGYNNIEERLPEHATTAGSVPLNRLSDKVRMNVALCGYSEVLNWALQSKVDNFGNMGLPEMPAVVVSNPKAKEFEICRVNLLPGVLRTLEKNVGQIPLPLSVFEVGDVVLLDPRRAVGARNERRLCVVHCSASTPAVEKVHGLLDRVMQQNGYRFAEIGQLRPDGWPPGKIYSVRPCEKKPFFPKFQAEVLVDGRVAGFFGFVHPVVSSNFGLKGVLVTALELNIEIFL